ncbi:MAG: biopolymer transporter ExbD [Prevotellaceae bacterium]|jgi:biopolymer transport protein ExbD|nr:biopolymer transporter ExbD [Prevotellaceae bacterium]
MAKRQLQEINAGSMADIAFLLLIFFLVTTTMDVDTGLLRRLPPIPDKSQKVEDTKVNKRNVLAVLVNAQDRLLVNGEPTDISQLRAKAKEFVANATDSPNLPERELKNIEGVGNVMVSKGVVSLQNDRGTSYQMYIKVQNELIAAYNEVQDEYAMQHFGKKFVALYDDEQEMVKKVYPQRISEAEPKNIGGN